MFIEFEAEWYSWKQRSSNVYKRNDERFMLAVTGYIQLADSHCQFLILLILFGFHLNFTLPHKRHKYYRFPENQFILSQNRMYP